MVSSLPSFRSRYPWRISARSFVGEPGSVGDLVEHRVQAAAPLGQHVLQQTVVAAVAVDYQNDGDTVGLQAPDDIEQVCPQGFLAQRQGALARHVIGGVSDRTTWSHHDLWIEQQGNLPGKKRRDDNVHVEGQVLVVLLDGADRDNGSFQTAALQRLADLLAGILAKHHPVGIDVAVRFGRHSSLHSSSRAEHPVTGAIEVRCPASEDDPPADPV